MLETIELDKIYTNRDDAEFVYIVNNFCTLWVTDCLTGLPTSCIAVYYEDDMGYSCTMPVEMFKAMFRLCTDEERRLFGDENE